MLEHQNEHILRDLFLKTPQISHFAASKSKFSYEFSYGSTSKSKFRARLPSIFVTCHKTACLPQKFAPCHQFVQRWQCDLQKTRSTTRWKSRACHAKWRWRPPKCCACDEKKNASSENVAKVLRLPRKTTFETAWNMLECHKVSRLPREMKLR